jgi:hypothetical protein
MFRFAKNSMAALALTGLVLSQPALAVRSFESLPAPGAKVSSVASRVGTPVGQSEEFVGIPALGLIIAALIAAGVIIVVAKDNKKDNRSPG